MPDVMQSIFMILGLLKVENVLYLNFESVKRFVACTYLRCVTDSNLQSLFQSSIILVAVIYLPA